MYRTVLEDAKSARIMSPVKCSDRILQTKNNNIKDGVSISDAVLLTIFNSDYFLKKTVIKANPPMRRITKRNANLLK